MEEPPGWALHDALLAQAAGGEEGERMTLPPCSCCGIVVDESQITPDGTYSYGSAILISFKCPCGTNRALRFEDISPALRKAAMLADLALRPDSPEMEG